MSSLRVFSNSPGQVMVPSFLAFHVALAVMKLIGADNSAAALGVQVVPTVLTFMFSFVGSLVILLFQLKALRAVMSHVVRVEASQKTAWAEDGQCDGGGGATPSPAQGGGASLSVTRVKYATIGIFFALSLGELPLLVSSMITPATPPAGDYLEQWPGGRSLNESGDSLTESMLNTYRAACAVWSLYYMCVFILSVWVSNWMHTHLKSVFAVAESFPHDAATKATLKTLRVRILRAQLSQRNST